MIYQTHKDNERRKIRKECAIQIITNDSLQNKKIDKENLVSNTPEKIITAPIVKISSRNNSVNAHQRSKTTACGRVFEHAKQNNLILTQANKNNIKPESGNEEEYKKPRISNFPNNLTIQPSDFCKHGCNSSSNKSPFYRRNSILSSSNLIKSQKSPRIIRNTLKSTLKY